MSTLNGKYCKWLQAVVQISQLRKLTKHSLISLAWKKKPVLNIRCLTFVFCMLFGRKQQGSYFKCSVSPVTAVIGGWGSECRCRSSPNYFQVCHTCGGGGRRSSHLTSALTTTEIPLKRESRWKHHIGIWSLIIRVQFSHKMWHKLLTGLISLSLI